MSQGPAYNEQFGQRIGVDDVSPPEVGHGDRTQESDMVPDPNQVGRARFVEPLERRPPPEEASWASEETELPHGPPTEMDVGEVPEAPSVWEAVDDDGEAEPAS